MLLGGVNSWGLHNYPGTKKTKKIEVQERPSSQFSLKQVQAGSRARQGPKFAKTKKKTCFGAILGLKIDPKFGHPF